MAAMILIASLGADGALATKLYSSGGALGVGAEIAASSEISTVFTGTEGNTIETCAGAGFGAGVANAGGESSTVSGPAAAAFAGCSFPIEVTEEGSFEIHHIASTTNGTLTAKGFKVDINTILFGHCVYTFGEGTDLGTLTGSTTTTAKLDVNAVIKKVSGGGVCASTGKWVATYTVTTPDRLWVEAS